MRILLAVAVMALMVVACGGGRGAERAPVDAKAGGGPVRIELAWVVAAAPTEVKEVECTLVLRVLRAGEARQGEMHELGKWWRAQPGAIELVEVKSASGPVFFRTEATFGEDGDLTTAPQFEVVREPGGRVIARGRDEDTPWRQLERIDVPRGTAVEARRPSAE